MKQTAIVIRTNPDRSAVVELIPSDGAAAPQRMSARNPIDAQPGETVLVETEKASLPMTALILYLLPLAAFIAGYLLGGNALWGAAAVVPVGVLGYLYNRRTRTAVITGRAGEDA